MDDQTAERIHLRIDQINTTINEVKLAYTAQCQDMKSLDETVKNFVKKVDKSIFDTEEGFIIKTKTKLSSICTQIKNQWYLITLLLGGIFGIAWTIIIVIMKK